jgi:uncharacterized surface protein with fasciclin (FAS1) repeats
LLVHKEIQELNVLLMVVTAEVVEEQLLRALNQLQMDQDQLQELEEQEQQLQLQVHQLLMLEVEEVEQILIQHQAVEQVEQVEEVEEQEEIIQEVWLQLQVQLTPEVVEAEDHIIPIPLLFQEQPAVQESLS